MRWCRHLQGPELQPLIAMDDPYAPDAQETGALWNAALIELEDLRQQGEGDALPLVICCGPTEQAQRLADDYGTDLMLEQFDLPREQSHELDALRAWYRQRTNEDPPHLDRDEDVLLVQLFFQWRVGQSLPDFAKRFRGRIQASDRGGVLESVLSRVLALNRLYAGYPTGIMDERLGPHLRGVLDQLRVEHHIAEYADSRRHGVWLAHPHLSNAIYEAWYPGARHLYVRAKHLEEAIGDALASAASPGERTAPLWALTRALAPGESHWIDEADRVARRVDRAPTIDLLGKIYALRAGVPESPMVTAELPVWVHLAALVPDLPLTPDPIGVAIGRLGDADVAEQGLRLTCHKLLQHLERMNEVLRARAIAAILDLLRRTPEWREWAPVALDVLWQTQQREVTRLIADWIPRYAPRSHIGAILIGALRAAPNDANLLAAAEALLPHAPASFDWGDIAFQFLGHSETPPTAVLQWTERHQFRVEECFVLGRLVGDSHAPAIGWGLTWANLWHRERAANYVLEPLWDQGVSPEVLKPWYLAWIRSCPPHADASFLLEKLIGTFPEDAMVQNVTAEWLTNTPPRTRILDIYLALPAEGEFREPRVNNTWSAVAR